MSHAKFEQNLTTLYEGCDTFPEFMKYNRIPMMFNLMKQEKDFRYIIPMFLLKLFDYGYFTHVYDVDPDIQELVKGLFIRTKRIGLAVKRSSESINKLASYHRCIPPKLDMQHLGDDSSNLTNTLVELPHEYKMQSYFFYENLCRFNLFGPLYVEQKDVERSKSKLTPWNRLPIEQRKISNCNCAIEYYIYTGTFPIEAKYVKKDNPHSRLYVKPTVEALRIAIKQRDPIALGRNISQYPLLPLTVKRSCKSFIKDNYQIIKENIRKSEQCYLTAWRLGNHSWTVENEILK